MIVFNLQTNDSVNQVIVELSSDAVYLEARSPVYIRGLIEMNTKLQTFSRVVKSHFLKSCHFKPKYEGTGQIYLKSSFFSFYEVVLEKNESLLVEKNTFWAGSPSLVIQPYISKPVADFFSGTPFARTEIIGPGNVILRSPGPVEMMNLVNDRLIVDGQVLAYSSTLKMTREKYGKISLSSMSQTDQTLNFYRGTGKIFFSPYPNPNVILSKF